MPGSAPGPADLAADASRSPATVTFLFTDVEGSTRMWERYPEAMTVVLQRHEEILRDAVAAAEGTVVKETGDGIMAAFPSATAALDAAIAGQRALLGEPWPDTCPIRVRMGLHSGDAQTRATDYFGRAVNRAARIMAAGHGGQILISASTAALIGEHLPNGADLEDLGEHRLKDLDRAERLLQVVHPNLPRDFPPLTTLNRRPNNLPIQASGFVGRERELEDIRGRLLDDNVRLLTLTGPGGTGKTRLALRAAAEQVDRFPDGVFLVDLVAATDSDDVVALVAAAIGLTDTRERAPLDDVKRQLRPQRVLLVMDNFEQVMSAAPTLAELLADCPSLKVVVTSREALHVRGENLLPVPPLSVPSRDRGPASAEELSRFEAIQLFVERARAVRADFRLTDDNAAAVAEICRRLDGLPLAIELVTARISLFTPDALRDRLGSRLKLLAGGARDLPARQQTLRATIDWSYQLLDPGEQRLFELLAVFSSASVEAAEAVAAELAVLTGTALNVVEDLGSLVDKSLVRHADAAGADGSPVMEMLETIREYAVEQLDVRPEFAAAARRAHATYFAEQAHESWKLAASKDGDPSLGAPASELENLRIAWRLWVAERDLARLDLLMDFLWHTYEARGWYHGTIELINDLLAILADQPSSDERWQRELTLRMSLARATTLLRGYTGEVEDIYAAALAVFEGHPEVPRPFPVLRGLSSFHGFRGEFGRSMELAEQIIELAAAENDQSMRVDGLVLLGSDTAFAGDLAGGLAHLDEAIQRFSTDGYKPRRLRLGNDPRVSCLTTSGFLLWLLGYPDRAVERADRAVAIAGDLNHPYSLAFALYHSGFVHLWRREPARIRDRAVELLGVIETNDFPIWRALGTALLGAARTAMGEREDGLAQIADGLDQYRGLRTPPVFWPLVRYMQAAAHVDARKPDAGLPLIREALELAGEDEVLAPLFHIVHGDLLLLASDADAAEAAYERARDNAVRFGARLPHLRAATRLAGLEAEPATRDARLAVVRELVAAFDEGLDTADLIDARALIEAAAAH
jgi:predicted ATPase/class 3 adenylate cyclase/tetratricopeptide (TPR) repeat protein